MRNRFLICLLIPMLLFSSCSVDTRDNGLTIGVVLDTSKKSSLHKSSIISACESMNIQMNDLIIETDILEENCFVKLEELIKRGCDILFAVGDGFEDYVIQAAQENPYIRFCYYGGKSHPDIRPGNFYTYAVDTSQQNYLAGVVAGHKLNELYENEILSNDKLKLGYIGVLPDADSISDYTAFYLGAKSVCEYAEMDVHFTGAYEDKTAELASAKILTAMGCAVISQHSVLNTAASVCEENGVFFVGNGTSVKGTAPACYLVSTASDYKACYMYALEKVSSGEALPNFWVCGAEDNIPQLTDFNAEAFLLEDTLNTAKTDVSNICGEFAQKKLGVFNINRFTVNGKKTETTVNEELYEMYFGVEYINKYNCFAEYEYSSSPKFAFEADGINQLNDDEFRAVIGG